MIDIYAVMGNPVTHSKSPFIHAEFAKQTHQRIHYYRIEVPLDKFHDHVLLFQLEQGKGLNITVPFKQQAFNLVNQCTERAKIAKSVNTIKFLEDGDLLGDNTDGVGFIRDLTEHQQFLLTGKRVLILGAGGAVRGILHPILEQQPSHTVIANRTLANAEQLAAEFSCYGTLYTCPLENIEAGPFDLIINGTSLSLQKEAINLTSNLLTENTLCYDLMYSKELTPFLKWAKQHGVTHLTDGIGMLVEQAAESFYLWRGIRPQTKPVIEMLKA